MIGRVDALSNDGKDLVAKGVVLDLFAQNVKSREPGVVISTAFGKWRDDLRVQPIDVCDQDVRSILRHLDNSRSALLPVLVEHGPKERRVLAKHSLVDGYDAVRGLLVLVDLDTGLDGDDAACVAGSSLLE